MIFFNKENNMIIMIILWRLIDTYFSPFWNCLSHFIKKNNLKRLRFQKGLTYLLISLNIFGKRENGDEKSYVNF